MNVLQRLRKQIERAMNDPAAELNRWARLLRFQVHLWSACFRRLRENNVFAMSAALSFQTLFAAIPVLVLAFLVLRSLGVLEDSRERLQDFLRASGFEQIAMAQQEQAAELPTAPPPSSQAADVVNVADKIEYVFDRVEKKLTLGRLGPVGVALLIWTALTLITSMEQSLNRIFGAGRGRSTFRRMALYWSVMTLAPTILAVASYLGGKITGAFAGAPGFGWGLVVMGWIGPILAAVLVLSAVYKMLPNTEVPYPAAMVGALVGVPMWLVAKWIFSIYVQKFVTTGNLYGVLGLVPLFMLWLHLSWFVFLFGAELAHAAANLDVFESDEQLEDVVFGPTDLLAAAVVVAQPYLAGDMPATLQDIASRLRLPNESTRWLLDRLQTSGVIHRLEGDTVPAYVPARAPGRIGLLEVLEIQNAPSCRTMDRYDAALLAVLHRVQSQANEALGALTLEAVVEKYLGSEAGEGMNSGEGPSS